MMTPEALKKMSLERLVEIFELTETVEDPAVFTVRGWLIDAIQEKNPEGFEAWINSDLPDDKELRRYVLKGEGK